MMGWLVTRSRNVVSLLLCMRAWLQSMITVLLSTPAQSHAPAISLALNNATQKCLHNIQSWMEQCCFRETINQIRLTTCKPAIPLACSELGAHLLQMLSHAQARR